MALSVVNNAWTINDTIISGSLDKTLDTAGRFLDRNIVISVSTKPGNVELSTDSHMEQKITLVNDNMYSIKATSKVTVTPTVTEGWVESVGSRVVDDENVIYINRTVLTSGLVPSAVAPAGSSYYRVTANAGYNTEDLTKDIDVFQGDITL